MARATSMRAATKRLLLGGVNGIGRSLGRAPWGRTAHILTYHQVRRHPSEILDLYNDAWRENWGYVAATDAEAEQLAADVKMLVDTEILPIIEVDGVPVGVALALPNLNEAIRDLNGRLLPFGFVKLLWRLRRKRFKSGRLLLLGIKKEFRTRKYAGLAYLLCDEIYRGARERGYDWAEFSWTLEDNHLINSLITKVGAKHYKTYRLFEKNL